MHTTEELGLPPGSGQPKGFKTVDSLKGLPDINFSLLPRKVTYHMFVDGRFEESFSWLQIDRTTSWLQTDRTNLP
jgi:hypothetical protein